MRKLLFSIPLLAFAACGRPERPPVMAEAASIKQSTAGQTAASFAPEAFAHAEKVRADAEAAYQAGDAAGAQILAERSIAAYQHALVLGRIARAAEIANRAKVALRAAEQTLALHEGEQKRISAEADDLETRVKVIKDAAPIVPAGPADAGRELARLASAKSLALDARLLCAAARMVGSDTPSLAQAKQAVDELDKRLSARPSPAPIDAAMRARALCLGSLTAARRNAGAASSIGRSDQLLSELSAMGGLAPLRDDRGVVVTLRSVFGPGEITKDGRDRLESLARVANAHPDFPVQVVLHTAGANAKVAPSPDRRGDSISKIFVDAGAKSDRVMVESAGGAHPVLDSSLSRDPARNERVEIIFVDPGG